MNWLKPNVLLERKLEKTSFRQLAINTWQVPNDPTTYLTIDLDATNMNQLIDTIRSKTGVMVTMNHMIAKILGHCFYLYPDMNRVLIGSKVYYRSEINIFLMVMMKSNKMLDLSGVTISNIHQLSILELVEHVNQRVSELKSGGDQAIQRVQKLLTLLPSFLLKPLLGLLRNIMYRWNLDLTFMGLPKDRFGSASISSVGSLGYDSALIPLFPFSNCHLNVSVGKCIKKPVVYKDDVVVRPTVNVSFSMDHRVMEGGQPARAFKWFCRVFQNPQGYLNDVFLLNDL